MDTPTKPAPVLDPVTGLAAAVEGLSATFWQASDDTRKMAKLLLIVQGQDQRLLDQLDTIIAQLQAERDKIAARLANEIAEAQS